MSTASHDERQKAAQAAYERIGANPSEHARLQVSCGRNHHVAAVYDTASGRVFRSTTHGRSHGHHDRPDSGDGHGAPWFDLLDAEPGPAVDDALPAGCACGPYSLSRRLLQEHIAAGERHIVLD
jgi:hypothetical protein